MNTTPRPAALSLLLLSAACGNSATTRDVTRQAPRGFRAPAESEIAAIDTRFEVMKAVGNSVRVAVYPARVGGDRIEESSARRVAALLDEAEVCQATAESTGPTLTGNGWPNEMQVLWLFADAASEYARHNPVDEDYSLFADYWFAPDGQVWAVHFVVCDRLGDLVILDLQNNHHDDFQRIHPKTTEDCDRLVADRLRTILH